MSLIASTSRIARRRDSVTRTHPKPLPTPSRPLGSPVPHSLLPSAPASPPTPAPSPTPHQRAPSWSTAGENEDAFLRDARSHFSRLDGAERQRYLAEILNLCDSHQLSFVHHFVSPRLKKDPFRCLPNELCLRVSLLSLVLTWTCAHMRFIKVLSFVDDPKTLSRASQVSRRWHDLLSDDMTWKILCDKHAYRRMSESTTPPSNPLPSVPNTGPGPYNQESSNGSPKRAHDSILPGPSASAPNLPTSGPSGSSSPKIKKRRPEATSYKSHFKQRYMVEAAWRKGGEAICRHITPDQGVVTSLHLTSKYIVVGLDNAKIHVFNTNGEHQRTLQGHIMGVWAMVPWDDTLVSGGCDRDVRVWNMATGYEHILQEIGRSYMLMTAE